MSEDPIGGPLVLRHASKRSSGTWGPDDYDVISNGWAISNALARVPPTVLGRGHHRRGSDAGASLARLLRQPGRGQGEE